MLNSLKSEAALNEERKQTTNVGFSPKEAKGRLAASQNQG
jgi:hypothetical protein